MWIFLIFVAVLIIWVVASYIKQNDSPQTKKDDAFNVGVAAYEMLREVADTCYENIDNMWSWADDDYYSEFQAKKQDVYKFLMKKAEVLLTVQSEEKAAMFMTFIMFQGFAFSFYKVMGLEQYLPGDVDSVIVTLTEVLEEHGHLSGTVDEEGNPENTIQRMINEVNMIAFAVKMRREYQ